MFKKLLVLIAVLLSTASIATACKELDSLNYGPGDDSYSVAARLLGLDSGKTYPLITGDLMPTTNANTAAQVGFYNPTSIGMGSGSGVGVIFKNDNRQWNLEIPMSKITFVIDDLKPRTIVMYLNPSDSYSGVVAKPRRIDNKPDPCDTKPLNECAHLVDGYDGLGSIVKEGLMGATLTVNREMADQLSSKR